RLGGGVAVAAAQSDDAVGPSPQPQGGQGDAGHDHQRRPAAGGQPRAQHPDDGVGGQDVSGVQEDAVEQAEHQQHQVAAGLAGQESAGALAATLGGAVQDADAVSEQQGEQGEAAVVDQQGQQHVDRAVQRRGVGLFDQCGPLLIVQPAKGVGQRDAQQRQTAG